MQTQESVFVLTQGGPPLVVTLRSGECAVVSQDSYRSNMVSGFQADEAGQNPFFANPSAANFNASDVSQSGHFSSWVKRRLSREEHTTVGFSEVTDIQLRGPSWQQILLNTRHGELVVVVVPRWASSTQDVQEVVRQLSTSLNVPLNVGDADRAFWRLDR